MMKESKMVHRMAILKGYPKELSSDLVVQTASPKAERKEWTKEQTIVQMKDLAQTHSSNIRPLLD